MLRFYSIILLAFICSLTLAQDGQTYIAHEWGTFTTLQRSNGERLSGLFRDEETLPWFVKNISFQYWHDDPWKGYYLGTVLKNVTVKMETPVIYFYSDRLRNVSVEVNFLGGSISEWYPDRTSGELNPGTDILDFSEQRIGWIKWDATVLAPGDQSAYSSNPNFETPQWIRPRATKSNLIRTFSGINSETEKFLFYRGIANFEVPLKVELNTSGDLVLTNNGNQPLDYVLVYEKKKDQQANIWWSGKMEEKLIKIVHEPNAPISKYELQEKLTQFELALKDAGLYLDEAKAMLNTWKESYFEHDGLRVFWVVPRSFSDYILPLNIVPDPDELERVMVGRSEVLTPEFEESLLNCGDQEFYDLWKGDRFYYSYMEVRAGGPIAEWTTIARDDYIEIGELNESLPFVVWPNPFEDVFTIYGNFATAEDINISVYNLMGKNIYSIHQPINNGLFREEFEINHLPAGIYLMKVSQGDKSWTAKVIKAR